MKSMNKITLFNILSTIILQGVALFTSPIFSRMLGPSNYGIVSVYNTWVSIIVVVFGLQTQSTLAIARTEYLKEDQIKYQASILTLSCLSYFIFSALMIVAIVPLSKAMNMQKAMYLLMLLHGFGQFCVNFVNIKFTYEFKADKNFFLSVITVISNITISMILINILPKETNYWGRIIGMTSTYAIFGIVICVFIFLKGKTFFNAKYWRLCIPLAIPIIFHNLSGLVLNQSNRVMLQNLSDNSIVGIYSLAFTFSSILSTIWSALNNSWVPFYYEFTKDNMIEEIKKHALNYMELFTVISMGFVLLAPEVYHVFANSDYWGGTTLIPVFAIGFYMIFLYSFPVNFEFYNKKTTVIAIGTSLAAAMNIVLNILMIRYYGMIGAAIAATIAYGLLFLFHCVCANKINVSAKYPFSIKFFIPHTLAFIITAIFCLLVGDSFKLIRWGFGALIGLWELYKIKIRKSIF